MKTKIMVIVLITIALIVPLTLTTTSAQSDIPYPIVDTNQGNCFDNNTQIECPSETSNFFGQDAQYTSNSPSYTNNNDGTITDNITHLVWTQTPDLNQDGIININDKLTTSEAKNYCATLSLANQTNWQLPTIKQLYSLILFSGKDVSGITSTDTSQLTPFIDTNYFDFAYGDTSANERIIDAQFASSTTYVSTTDGTLQFGVNFADGRIKGYWTNNPQGQEKTFYIYCVQENSTYGINQFLENQDGTISDLATGLIWSQNDSQTTMSWQAALEYVQELNQNKYLGYSDWRLPNIKELQSIVDYTRSPDTSNSAAISPLFNSTSFINEEGQPDWGYYWSSTTHINSNNTNSGANAAYISFGRALGYMRSQWMDVHGAGAQRSDPKTGSASQYPTGHGPQGDAIRIQNYVRVVREGSVTLTQDGDPTQQSQNQSNPNTTSINQPPQSSEIDLSYPAQLLGISEQELQQALGAPPPDFEAAAANLGITVSELKQALGIPNAGAPPQK